MNRFALTTLVILATLSGLAFAQGSGSTEPRESSAASKSADSNFSVTRTISGTIIDVNAKGKRLVLKDSKGKFHQLKVSDDTKYQSATKNLALRDLHDGQTVKITYRAADFTALDVHLADVRTQRR